MEVGGGGGEGGGCWINWMKPAPVDTRRRFKVYNHPINT